jgi:hypothetical protein
MNSRLVESPQHANTFKPRDQWMLFVGAAKIKLYFFCILNSLFIINIQSSSYKACIIIVSESLLECRYVIWLSFSCRPYGLLVRDLLSSHLEAGRAPSPLETLHSFTETLRFSLTLCPIYFISTYLKINSKFPSPMYSTFILWHIFHVSSH